MPILLQFYIKAVFNPPRNFQVLYIVIFKVFYLIRSEGIGSNSLKLISSPSWESYVSIYFTKLNAIFKNIHTPPVINTAS